MIDPRFSIYDLYLYNHGGTKVLLVDTYEFLEFNQTISDSWNHILRINYAPDDSRLTFYRTTLVRDFFFEIHRYDPVTQVREIVYEGFHRTLVDQMKQDGSVVLTLYGTGYSQLLKRRIIIPAVGQENSVKTGIASTAMKAYVTDQAITPTDATPVITGLSNDSGAAVGTPLIVRPSAR